MPVGATRDMNNASWYARLMSAAAPSPRAAAAAVIAAMTAGAH